MIVVVTGGRDFDNKDMVFSVLDNIYPQIVIHGGASGADALADRWAKAMSKPHIVYPANWKAEGRAAGPIRNRSMLNFALTLIKNPGLTAEKVELVAFPGGRGTDNCVKTAKELGVNVRDFRANSAEVTIE